MRLLLRASVTPTWEDMALEVTLSSVWVKCTYEMHLVKWSGIYHD